MTISCQHGHLARSCEICELIAALRSARARIGELEAVCERMYDALLKNLDNMSAHNQDALRPVAMKILAVLASDNALTPTTEGDEGE